MSHPNWIGKTLANRYRIDEILGQGGMSSVYKAYDPNLKRVVALKMIHAHLANDPHFISRFEEEAAAVAQLRHPNIVQVFDFDHDQDLYFMVQEFIPGETLQDRLRRLNQDGKRLPIEESIKYAQEISAASGYAHARGMIHRDIKPANIMLDVQGQAILMDFGIVKIFGGQIHTATGAVLGTALYIPPEVIRSESPDARSDLYSLGVTLFEMVNGSPPFDADSAMTVMMMHINDPIPDLRRLRPDVPVQLISVIERALAKDRNARYGSMAEFSQALQQAQDQISGKFISAAGLAAGYAATIPSKDPLGVETPRDTTGQGEQEYATGRIPPAGTMPIESTVRAGSPEAATPGSPAGANIGGVGGLTPVVPPGGGGTAAPPAVSQGESRPQRNWILFAAGIAAILLVAIGAYLLFNGRGENTPEEPAAAAASETTEQAIAPVLAETSTPSITPSQTPTLTSTPTPTITPTPLPTRTPTPTLSPTPTIPVGVFYSVIEAIELNDAEQYIVDYETYEFTEILPGDHVHFFFNTTPPEDAGAPASGPWYVWGGPRPFDRYGQSQRPAAASQMCVLVANPDHSVRMESGNCFTLPEVNVAVVGPDLACLTGPDPAFPALLEFEAGKVVVINGISADEAWWNVTDYENPDESCWLDRKETLFAGDMSSLPLVESPPLPAGAATSKTITITGIRLDSQGRYVVEYQTQGYTEQLPGTHIHFFYDIYAAEQLEGSGGGNRIMFGGPSPFTGFVESTRPAQATAICALVANPDHTVIPDSGNCYAIP